MSQPSPNGYDLRDAVPYHYGKFPPAGIDYGRLMMLVSSASEALARYDQMLKGLHNSSLLLAPLQSQEAVVSSRMEGTVSTLDEVLRYEADREDSEGEAEAKYRSEAIEVWLYSRALRLSQQRIKEGQPISKFLLRSTHNVLLGYGRGAAMSPGEFKTEQNYLVDRSRRKVQFVPIRPENLNDGLDAMMTFMDNTDWEILIRTALVHLEFEALHPFKDGNGRIGRMLIPLMLWKHGKISEPYFYMSGYLEQRRDDYIDKMRAVSANDEWTEWVIFFLEAIEAQAQKNLQVAEQIRSLYEEMKERFRSVLSSQWGVAALDFVFTRPVFRNNVFTTRSGIPSATAYRFVRALQEAKLLEVVSPSAGRRPAMYSFEPLLALVRG
ncbi:Fic family protein [Methylobacterium sp. OAE515]|uniref:Fic family protein n=1 Tax=Methylobacterium sp. OAE515 TaxID=2817895 RepID=UPI0019F7DEDA